MANRRQEILDTLPPHLRVTAEQIGVNTREAIALREGYHRDPSGNDPQMTEVLVDRDERTQYGPHLGDRHRQQQFENLPATVQSWMKAEGSDENPLKVDSASKFFEEHRKRLNSKQGVDTEKPSTPKRTNYSPYSHNDQPGGQVKVMADGKNIAKGPLTRRAVLPHPSELPGYLQSAQLSLQKAGKDVVPYTKGDSPLAQTGRNVTEILNQGLQQAAPMHIANVERGIIGAVRAHQQIQESATAQIAALQNGMVQGLETALRNSRHKLTLDKTTHTTKTTQPGWLGRVLGGKAVTESTTTHKMATQDTLPPNSSWIAKVRHSTPAVSFKTATGLGAVSVAGPKGELENNSAPLSHSYVHHDGRGGVSAGTSTPYAHTVAAVGSFSEFNIGSGESSGSISVHTGSGGWDND